jgi:SAM-dependent methyltransferase
MTLQAFSAEQRLPEELCCPQHTVAFLPRVDPAEPLCCPLGCLFEIRDAIPRFVASEGYTGPFGWQWRKFSRIQLDSYTGVTITRDRLARCLGGDLGVVEGKSVLEVGCGSGRFTEILLGAGARVFACDLSLAVEAAFANFGSRVSYFICQADILHLPAQKRAFDIVLCLGVVQHTPNPEATIAALSSYVRPGGLLVFDHYSLDYPYTTPRKILREINLRLPPQLASRMTLALCHGLVKLHSRFWVSNAKAASWRQWLQRYSPLVDYFDAYHELPRDVLEQWCLLDTHDTVTDRYKHLRSVEQIRKQLDQLGLANIHVERGGNGVEARAHCPFVPKATVALAPEIS